MHQLIALSCQGLSPLARGNPKDATASGWVSGPIPARAGEPEYTLIGLRFVRAYPRSRGGTRDSMPIDSPALGLSPLARGNHSKKPSK